MHGIVRPFTSQQLCTVIPQFTHVAEQRRDANTIQYAVQLSARCMMLDDAGIFTRADIISPPEVLPMLDQTCQRGIHLGNGTAPDSTNPNRALCTLQFAHRAASANFARPSSATYLPTKAEPHG